MTTPTRRRWFQYSLRTMFVVVTVVALFVGWIRSEWVFICKRADWDANDLYAMNGVWTKTFDIRNPNPQIPFWRRWLGDKPRVGYTFPLDASDEDVARAQTLFPEARVNRYPE